MHWQIPELLLYEALSYCRMRPQATAVCRLKLLLDEIRWQIPELRLYEALSYCRMRP